MGRSTTEKSEVGPHARATPPARNPRFTLDDGISNNAGAWESVHAELTISTNRMVREVTFSNQITTGFTLAVNNGPNPKGHPGELALIYVDAENENDLRIAAYGYDGQNLQNSWQDGNGDVGGNPAPDKLHSILDGSACFFARHHSGSLHAGKNPCKKRAILSEFPLLLSLPVVYWRPCWRKGPLGSASGSDLNSQRVGRPRARWAAVVVCLRLFREECEP